MRDDEFEALYEAEAANLFAFLAYRTGDRALAQDLVADSFERALRARGRFDRRKGSPRTWLYAIAMNALRDHARRAGAAKRASERLASRVSTPAIDIAARVADHDELYAAIATLSEEERTVIALRYGAELTIPQIAEALGERLTTVEGRVYRALRKLRDALA